VYADVSTDTELAFEEGIHGSPQFLWRVQSWRQFRDRRLRHTNWFATEDAARKHGAWINDGRGEVISVKKYVLDESC
jgi:hypothetical protein